MSTTVFLWTVFALVAAGAAALAIRIVRQYEGGVVLRFGKLVGVRTPGFNVIIPIVDRIYIIDTRTHTLTVEPQEVITRDNVTIKVDAVVYFAVTSGQGADPGRRLHAGDVADCPHDAPQRAWPIGARRAAGAP